MDRSLHPHDDLELKGSQNASLPGARLLQAILLAIYVDKFLVHLFWEHHMLAKSNLFFQSLISQKSVPFYSFD
ncbi:hypothetical protein ES705_45245 [subsurface metagenome]